MVCDKAIRYYIRYRISTQQPNEVFLRIAKEQPNEAEKKSNVTRNYTGIMFKFLD